MQYFVTGAAGFIGKRRVKKRLARKGSRVYFLTRQGSRDKVPALLDNWGCSMLLERAPMIAPTRIYPNVQALAPKEAPDLIANAIVYTPVRIATRVGIAGQLLHATAARGPK